MSQISSNSNISRRILNDQASNIFFYEVTSTSPYSTKYDTQYAREALSHSETSSSTVSLYSNCSKDNLITPMIINVFYSHTFQVILYFCFLIYLFLGVAIVSDIFMCAIERITSSTKTIKKVKNVTRCQHTSSNTVDTNVKCSQVNCQVKQQMQVEEIPVKIWNDTVANLTLMALGSSSPEILLSIIEVISSGFKAGELGAGTIVGSAAFNLLIISAACISSLPDNVSKKINNLHVYMITSFFSIFAYIWLVIILIIISPQVIELWEAIFTFTLFIILVTAAYFADIKSNNYNTHDNSISNDTMKKQSYFFPQGCITKKSLHMFMDHIRRIDPTVTDEDTVCLAVAHLFETENHSKAFYRVSAIRSFLGVQSPIPQLTPRLKMIHDALKNQNNFIVRLSDKYDDIIAGAVADTCDQLQGVFRVTINETKSHVSSNDKTIACHNRTSFKHDRRTVNSSHENHDISIIQFESPDVYAYEDAGSIQLKLLRTGKITNQVTIKLTTIDHSAISNVHYIPVDQLFTFTPGEKVKYINVTIIDDNILNADRIFLAKISLPENINDDDSTVAIGDNYITVITIVDDDEPGTISFADKIYTVPFNSNEIRVPVVRENGHDGKIKVKYTVIDGTAVNGKHYQCYPTDKWLSLSHAVERADIVIQLLPNTKNVYHDSELFFEVNLTTCFIETAQHCIQQDEDELQLNLDDKSEQECAHRIGKNHKAVIVLTDNDDVNTTKLLSKINEARDGFRLNANVWRDQLISAVSIQVSDDDNKLIAWLLHIITFHWKILFALIPPVGIWRGWLTFATSLTLIGVLTAIIGDVASTLGCLININPSLNAITFVAMGTSMPDLFASVTAIRMDSTADNAIGNITGSNSVNVFLGLGLPWMLASIYWSVKGQQFHVPTGDIIFCVALYTVIAIIAITVLAVRRFSPKIAAGEVGGPKKWALATSFLFVILWIVYITLSALSLYNIFSI